MTRVPGACWDFSVPCFRFKIISAAFLDGDNGTETQLGSVGLITQDWVCWKGSLRSGF